MADAAIVAQGALATLVDEPAAAEPHLALHEIEESLDSLLLGVAWFATIVGVAAVLALAVFAGCRMLTAQAHVHRHWAHAAGSLAGLLVFLAGVYLALRAVGVNNFSNVIVVFGIGFFLATTLCGPLLAGVRNYFALLSSDLLDDPHDVLLRVDGREYRGVLLAVGLYEIEMRTYGGRDPRLPRGGTDELGRPFADETHLLPVEKVLAEAKTVRWDASRGVVPHERFRAAPPDTGLLALPAAPPPQARLEPRPAVPARFEQFRFDFSPKDR